jgi:hypothetical protein
MNTAPTPVPAFAKLFDNANVFPPGLAPLESAVALQRAITTGSYAWMVGRLLLPSALLSVLPAALDVVWPDAVLNLAVIADADAQTVFTRCQALKEPRVHLDQLVKRLTCSVLCSPVSTAWL